MSAVVLNFPAMKKSDEDLPIRMRYWRKQRGLTLKEVADRMGCTEQTAQRYETGTRTTTLEVLARMARALDVEVADLLPASLNSLAVNDREQQLLRAYRAAPDLGRRNLEVLAESMASWTPEPADLGAARASKSRK